MSSTFRIIGIDPGSRVTGFGVIEVQRGQFRHVSHGAIVLPAKAELPKRLVALGADLEQILKKYEPKIAVIEKVFLGKNVASAFTLGHARGVAMFKCQKFECELYEYATRVIKRGITGRGAGDKKEVQFWLQRILGIKNIEPFDASDALALAVYQAQQMNLSQKMNRGVEL